MWRQALRQVYVQCGTAHAPSASTFMGSLCGCCSVRCYEDAMRYGPIISPWASVQGGATDDGSDGQRRVFVHKTLWLDRRHETLSLLLLLVVILRARRCKHDPSYCTAITSCGYLLHSLIAKQSVLIGLWLFCAGA